MSWVENFLKTNKGGGKSTRDQAVQNIRKKQNISYIMNDVFTSAFIPSPVESQGLFYTSLDRNPNDLLTGSN